MSDEEFFPSTWYGERSSEELNLEVQEGFDGVIRIVEKPFTGGKGVPRIVLYLSGNESYCAISFPADKERGLLDYFGVDKTAELIGKRARVYTAEQRINGLVERVLTCGIGKI